MIYNQEQFSIFFIDQVNVCIVFTVRKDIVILFYTDGIADLMACFQNGPWFVP